MSAPVYRLDWLGGEWGEDGDACLGMLPSAANELSSTLNIDDSQFSKQHGISNTLNVVLNHQLRLPNRRWLQLKADLNIDYWDAHLNHNQYDKLYQASRSSWLYSHDVQLNWRPMADDKNGMKMNVWLRYQTRATSPDLSYLITAVNANNPLYVVVGNPDLKNAHNHDVELGFERSWNSGAAFSTYAKYIRYNNLIAAEQSIDRETGITTSRWVNVDGNWEAKYELWGNVPLDRDRKFWLQGRLQPSYTNSLDMALVEGESLSSASRVKTAGLISSLMLSWWMSGSSSITPSVYANWRDVHSDRMGFTNFHVLEVDYSISASTELPGKVKLSTSLSVRTRNGYSGADLDDTRIRWNLQISRTIGAWTLMVKGYDLLGRYSNTSVYLDSQGRTQTWTNSLPRYVIFSVTYRFDKVAKKKD